MEGAHGDSITNDVYPFGQMWQVTLDVTDGDPVTAPRVEFQSSRTFEDIDPTPTRIDPGPTYVWDYPDMTLTNGGTPVFLDAHEGTFLGRPGLTVTRAVDTPLLTSDSATQTVDFTVRFDEALPLEVNNVFIGIGTFDFDQDMVAEIVTFQNTVPGWSFASSGWGNAGWGTTGSGITVGAEYHFQAQIFCTKTPGHEGRTIYHKPRAFVSYAAIYNPPDHTGTWTVNTHPLGETATYHVAETVNWERMTTTSRQDTHLATVSLIVDNTGLHVAGIEMTYGAMYDGEGTYLGHNAGINVTGSNMVAASVSTPTGRIWDLEIEGDGAWLGLDDAVSTDDLAALGLVSGTYTFTFTGPDGNTLVTSVDMTQWTPEQVPNITAPADGAMDVPVSQTVTWDAVWDDTVSGIYLNLEDADDTWWHEVMLPREASSHLVSGIPGSANIECFLAFGGVVSGTTAEGIDWTAIGYNGQRILFSTAAGVLGDTDGDGDVDLDDLFAVRNNFGTTSGATKAGGDTDEDGDVDLDDLFNVRNNFGTGLTIPEPMTLSVMVLGGLALILRKR